MKRFFFALMSFSFAMTCPSILAQSLQEALDTPNIAWSLGGNTPRGGGQTLITHDGVDAYQTGNISDNQSISLQSTTPIIGPGNLTFWWKVSSENAFDVWSFYLIPTGLTKFDAVEQDEISDEVDWTLVTIPVPEGSYSLRWEYVKDGSADGGSDQAWLDQVIFAPASPIITESPADILTAVGSNVLFSVGYVATEAKFFWQFNSTNLVGKTNATLSLTNVQVSQSGNYRVIITNSSGSVTSDIAVLTVFQPLPLALALDTTNMVWTTGGSESGLAWFGFTNSLLSHDGIDAARAPLPPDDEEIGDYDSWIETRVTGPGTIKFWWKLTGLDTDTLRFYVHGFDQQIVPPEDGSWEQKTIGVPAGANRELRWVYVREDFINTDEHDSGYLDQVVFIPATNAPPTFSFPSFSEEGFSALITHDPSRTYRVQRATNLVSPIMWVDVTNFNQPSAQFQFIDASATNFGSRFYRVITTP